MQIVEKNEGTKIGYNLRGTKLSFADGEITLDLARYQRDDEVTKDIMVDPDGYLTMGKGRYYVAQVEIPAREYDEDTTTETVEENGEEVTREVVNRTPKPIDMNKVVLYLFSIDGIIIY
ncbi:MAG: hypothetical protein K6E75_03600 [Lachnospiraceae bacterium]|nr:hypothetical protein [Lachnospiraceae bacterium]